VKRLVAALSLDPGTGSIIDSVGWAHLKNGETRTRQRLKVLAVLPDPDLPAYMHRIA